MPRRVFITVAEVSGDASAAELARELLRLDPDLVLEGLGGAAMQAAGVTIHKDTVSGSAMGLAAVGRVLEVRNLLAWTRKYYQKNKPDLHICVDSWSMNCRFAALAKSMVVPVLYYVAPQAWASRPGRVKKLRDCVDKLACILPFEEKWFGERGVPAKFVGHPLFDRLPAVRRERREFSGSAPVVALVPGSRRGVARANFSPMLDAAKFVVHAFPGARFVIPTTEVTDPIVRDELARRDLSQGFTVVQDGFDDLVQQADLAITVSGTSTLHLAAHNVPMIVVYRGSRVLWNLLGRWIISARTFAIVNILSGRDEHIVPEFIPWSGPADAVGHCAVEYLRYPERLAKQRTALAEMIGPLSTAGASGRVAEMALGLLKRGG